MCQYKELLLENFNRSYDQEEYCIKSRGGYVIPIPKILALSIAEKHKKELLEQYEEKVTINL